MCVCLFPPFVCVRCMFDCFGLEGVPLLFCMCFNVCFLRVLFKRLCVCCFAVLIVVVVCCWSFPLVCVVCSYVCCVLVECCVVVVLSVFVYVCVLCVFCFNICLCVTWCILFFWCVCAVVFRLCVLRVLLFVVCLSCV